ncbi:MAG: hypothetical protein RIC55_32855 [Pirellulaceae bacterium]
MSENRVVIYSNGIADFQRGYDLTAETPRRISIPVRQDHLADVLASFNVYGDVKLESPPTFRPSNELEGNLTIDPRRVLEDLAATLSGARVRIERAGGAVAGVLVGLHQESEATAGEPMESKSLVVLTDDGLRRCVLREVQSLKFLDEDVQAEIDKALRRNYQRIKPNSTFVELVLSTAEKQTEAVVQYTIPAAAWKISYRLRLAEGRATELQGFAIVDNNTDEDWTDFLVCVVTGEPITFSTDLAESKTPRRNRVNLVSETALGAAEAEGPVVVMGAEAEFGGGGDEDFDAPTGQGKFRKAAPTIAGRQMMMRQSRDMAPRAAAEMSRADIQEVGDFNLFESESPVTIPAKRSTVIPVFQVEQADAKSVLHYKHENHPERPYRSIDFTNQTGFSLGRGVCTVFEEAVYAGNCILPPLKPQENRLLPHALETGVSVHRNPKRQRNKIVALRLSEGCCYTSTRQHRETEYHVKNNRDVAHQLVLDHEYLLTEPDLEARLLQQGGDEPLAVAAKLTAGVRYSVSLAPMSELVVRVEEQRIDQSRMELITVSKQHEDFRIAWLEQNLVKTNGPLALDEGVQQCLAIHQQMEAKQEETTEAVRETERLAARQERLRQNIKAGGQDELTNRWRGELDAAEQSIRKIEEETIPALREEEKTLRTKLRDALRSLAAEWANVGV